MTQTFLINAANLQKGGGLQVALSLLEEWRAYDKYRFVVLASPQLAAAHPNISAGNIRLIPLAQNPSASLAAWRRFLGTARELEEARRPQAVLTIFGPALWRPRAPHLIGFANGLYLFSDSRFIREDWPVGYAARMRYAIRRRVLLHRVHSEADAWWVETEDAKKVLATAARIDARRISVVPNALGNAFLPYLSKPEQCLETGYFDVLVMGAQYPNKNLALIPPMLSFLRDRPIRFHFTLPEEDFRKLFPDDTSLLTVHNFGPRHPADAPTVYAQCDIVFSPTKLETFSAVYLEAMAMQRPLVASDLSFARAVCGDAAHYFDAWNPADAARAICDVMDRPDLRRTLVERGRRRLKEFPTAADRAATLLVLLKNLAGAPGS